MLAKAAAVYLGPMQTSFKILVPIAFTALSQSGFRYNVSLTSDTLVFIWDSHVIVSLTRDTLEVFKKFYSFHYLTNSSMVLSHLKNDASVI